MLFPTTQVAQAEMTYRTERISRDFAQASAWRQRRAAAKQERALQAVEAAEARVVEAAQAAHTTHELQSPASLHTARHHARHARRGLRPTQAA
ncbi:hypothetical protein [Kribbella deserti]|uniref:Uncharacterized protein n=1 Tax=Kribbella deserti TaxID=1926257 RepID=A0ABV6QVG9_9ACTN